MSKDLQQIASAQKISQEENALKSVQVEREREKLNNDVQNREERKRYASKIFDFLCIYMFLVGLLLFLSGNTYSSFHLSDSVLLMILGTTTTNVLGTFFFVANYLFPKQ